MPLLCQWSRLFVSILVGIPSESECLCPTLGMSSSGIVVPTLPVSLRTVDSLVSGVLMAVAVGRVYGWPIEPQFLRDLSNVHHRPLWWWCHWWIHPLMPQWMGFPLLRGMPFQDGLLTAVSHPVWVMIGVASLDHMCPRTHPGVDCCLVLFLSSLTVVYSAVAVVVPKSNLRQRKATLLNILMHVDAVVVFACIRP